MELTAFGQALLPHATVLSEEAAVALEQINSLRGLGHGTLRVGAIGSVAVTVLPAVLERMLAQWPKLNVQITEAVEDVLEVALTHNTIDVAIAGAIPESEQIMQVAQAPFTDRHAVICAAHHPLLKRKGLAVRDVLNVPWVMPPGDAEPRRQFNALMARPRRGAAASRRRNTLAGRDQGDGGANELSGVVAGTAVHHRAASGIDPVATAERDGVSAQVLRLSAKRRRHAAPAGEVSGGAPSAAGDVASAGAVAASAPAAAVGAPTAAGAGSPDEGSITTAPGCATAGASAGTATSFIRITTRPIRLSPSRSTCRIASIAISSL